MASTDVELEECGSDTRVILGFQFMVVVMTYVCGGVPS